MVKLLCDVLGYEDSLSAHANREEMVEQPMTLEKGTLRE
jgi:hypothetical protein